MRPHLITILTTTFIGMMMIYYGLVALFAILIVAVAFTVDISYFYLDHYRNLIFNLNNEKGLNKIVDPSIYEVNFLIARR